jgi:hypothetical protein
MIRKSDDTEGRTCQSSKPDGSRCLVKVPENGKFCFFHDPAKAEERHDAQVRGGQGNGAPSPQFELLESAPRTKADLIPFLVAVTNRALRGEIPNNRVIAICSLVNTTMKALDATESDRRLHDLEQAMRKYETREVLFDPYEEGEN